MIIRKYQVQDITDIKLMGNKLHNNYEFKLDTFSDCLVIINESFLIGFIIYSTIYERAEIVDLYVDEKYRNMGCAKQLIKSVINNCKENNCNNITLEVNKNNIPAISLYKYFGFKDVSIRKSYYDDGNDALLMNKNLR